MQTLYTHTHTHTHTIQTHISGVCVYMCANIPFSQAGTLAYVVTSCSLGFVSWLGRIITHYEYVFTSEQGTSSEILMRDGVKSRPGQDGCIGTLCIREHSTIHENLVSPNETNWSPYWDLKSGPSEYQSDTPTTELCTHLSRGVEHRLLVVTHKHSNTGTHTMLITSRTNKNSLQLVITT